MKKSQSEFSGLKMNTEKDKEFLKDNILLDILKDDKFKDQVISLIPIGRLGDIEDLIGPFVFLASDASSLMTGSSILVDGGWTAR